MNITFSKLLVSTKKTVETIDLSSKITYIYGPISKGKSTVARLIDFCLGGDLERTPAIQQEFVSAALYVKFGKYDCVIERAGEDRGHVRVTWSGPKDDIGSINMPLEAQDAPLIGDSIFCFSDLIYSFCGVTPIMVRKRRRDYDSPLIRLGFRDIWRYCFLAQEHLDSSFFQFEHPYKGRKSQDAMRFITGLHSERYSQIETELMQAKDEQRAKREAVQQIRDFMEEFALGSEIELEQQLEDVRCEITAKRVEQQELKKARTTEIHPTDALRDQIRNLSEIISEIKIAYIDSKEVINEQRSLRAELVTAKIKTNRAEKANQVLDGVKIERCPECGTCVSDKVAEEDRCRLCGSEHGSITSESGETLELVRRELDVRIDEIEDSIKRREVALEKTKRELDAVLAKKRMLDKQLQEALAIYDSAIVEKRREIDRELATLEEKLNSINTLIKMPQAIAKLEEQAGSIQGKIDRLNTELGEERQRLAEADDNVLAIADRFKEIMLNVGFPGVYEEDTVRIDTRNWKPYIEHKDFDWRFEDSGSGGKKTLFNVCYTLAIHAIAEERGLPVPAVLVIDSPTKNISEDEDPELVKSLYKEIYRLIDDNNDQTQLLLIDSDLYVPEDDRHTSFSTRHMAGTKDDPSLIPYYEGP